MKRKIAVEPNLSPVKEYLTEKGLKVESVDFNQMPANHSNSYDAIIVTGLNTNFMGIEDTDTRSVVINAEGMTPEEIFNQLQSRLR